MVVVSTNRNAWRRESRSVRRWNVVLRYLRFLGALGLLCAGIACLTNLIRQPFGHPNVKFLFLTGADLSGNIDGFFEQPGIAYPGEELAGLTRVRQFVFGNTNNTDIGLKRWNSPSEIHSLGLKLVESNLSNNDIVIIEIVAAGVSSHGEAQFCWNFGRASESVNHIRVADLLQQVRQSTNAHKLLIIDAGNVQSLPHEGGILNDFSRLLGDSVEKTCDDHLWVLCSHGRLENSHVIESQKRSVFGYYVEQGLIGAADLNSDLQIDVSELHEWVAHAVSEYVDRRTGGMESQTPQLYWGGTGHFNERKHPTIVPVRKAKAIDQKVAIVPKDNAADGKSSSVAEEKGAGEDKSVTAVSNETSAEELISEAWKLTNDITARKSDSPTAIDLAPHLIGALTDRLHAYETLVPGSGNVSPNELSNKLLPVLGPLRGIIITPPVAPTGTGTGVGTRLAKAMWPIPLPKTPVYSLAIAELLAKRNIHPIPKRLEELCQEFDKFISQDERNGFDEWLNNLEPNEQSLAELHGLQKLAQISDLTWPLIRAAMTARRISEQAAVQSLGCLDIVKDEILVADRQLLAGETLLLDGVQRERNSLATAAFTAAIAAYRTASQHSITYLEAVHRRNDLLVRAHDYVRWWRAAALRSDKVSPEFNDVAEFLDDLNRFCELIEIQDSSDKVEINDLLLRLEERQHKIESTAEHDLVHALATSASSPRDIAQIESLLETSFLASDLRPRLRTAAQTAASTISLEVSPLEMRRNVAAPQIVQQRQRDCISQMVQLELRMARLAEISEEVSPRSGSFLSLLEQLAENVEKSQQECIERPGNKSRLDDWSNACGLFDRTIQDWNQRLPERLQSTVTALSDSQLDTTAWARGWRGISRTLRLLRGKERLSAAADVLLGHIQLAEWRELLAFQEQRAKAASTNTSHSKSEYQVSLAESYRQAALAIGPVPRLATNSSPSMILSGTPELSLSEEVEGEVLVTIQNRLNTPSSTWIAIDYDRDLLDVRLPVDYTVYREPVATSSGRYHHQKDSILNPSLQRGSPSLILNPGARKVLKFVVRRVGSSTSPTKLIVKASGGSTNVRYECTVRVPIPETIELLIDGPARSWTASNSGFQLHPFPNKRTAFQLLIQNDGQPRVLDLELFPLERKPSLPLQSGLLLKEHAERLLRSLTLGPRLAVVTGFKLDADRVPHAIPLTGPLPPDPEKPLIDDKLGVKAGIAELPFGALLIITESGNGNKIFKHLEFSPQRPHRYVTSRVEYRPESQLANILIRRTDKTKSASRIKVRCEMKSSSVSTASTRTAIGEIAEDELETQFILPVPMGNENLTLAIDIDGFPRAFRYQISPRQPGGEVAEDIGSLVIRANIRDSTSLFACPRKFVNANVEIDAPPGSVADGLGYWEVGIDKGLDRELVQDTVVRFTVDRQARSRLCGYLPDGRLVIDTTVSDFVVSLPADGVCNQRALIVAHANVSGRDAWSNPVEIVLDGSGPRVANIAVGPDRVLVSGKDVEVAATVTDGDLSGVAKVDVSFDLEGTGRFAKEPPPTPAILSQNGTWVAKLTTEKMAPGSYLILVRATDKAGNQSEYGRVVAVLSSPEDLERQRAAVRVTLRGAVEFEKGPVPGAKVSLEFVEPAPKAAGTPAANSEKAGGDKSQTTALPSATFQPILTDDQGLFAFSKVPPGKYKLKSEAIIRNKTRKATLDITIDEQTPFKPAPRLKLP